MIRLLLALIFAAQTAETSLIASGRYAEANQAFARMELEEYVRPGLTGARVRAILNAQFPGEDAVVAGEVPAGETGRLRAFERVGAERFQVTTVDGRTFAITPGPRAATIKVDGKVVRLNHASEFIADMRAALGKTIALHGLGLLVPDRADAILNIAATVVLAAAVGAYAAWSTRKNPTTEAYLAGLASTCVDERDKQGVAFEASRTAATFEKAIERRVLPANGAKLNCPGYVQSIVRTASAERVRAGDPAKTCEQMRAYVGCVEAYRGQTARVQKASDVQPDSSR